MRFANNFNPEWGYLAPAPSFARTARIVLVAAAVGATAGGAVVFSLAEHPAAEDTSLVARTLVQPADWRMTGTEPRRTQARLPPQPQVHANARTVVGSEPAMTSGAHAGGPAASESGTSSTVQGQGSLAGPAEAPPASDTAPAAVVGETAAAADATPERKKIVKKQRYSRRSGPRVEQAYGESKGPLTFLRSFTTATWRGDY